MVLPKSLKNYWKKAMGFGQQSAAFGDFGDEHLRLSIGFLPADDHGQRHHDGPGADARQ